MPRGYRYVIVAAVGWLALAGSSSPAGQRAKAEQASAQSEVRDSLRSIASSLENANEPERENADCAKGSEDRKSDLCAQWYAADAANESAKWGFWTVVIGWAGLALGAVTMGAAIAAAYFAMLASNHTRDANLILRRHEKSGNEAVIRFEIRANVSPQEGLLFFELVNEGFTDANNLTVRADLIVREHTVEKNKIEASIARLAPKEKGHVNFRFETEPVISIIKSSFIGLTGPETERLTVTGQISHDSEFGERVTKHFTRNYRADVSYSAEHDFSYIGINHATISEYATPVDWIAREPIT